VNPDALRVLLETEFARRYGRLVQIIRSHILDFVTVEEGCIRPRPLGDIDPERRVALKTYRVRQTPRGQSVRVVMHDKLKACSILLSVYQAHGKRLDRVGAVVGTEPARAASTRPSACVTRIEESQVVQLEDMSELAALFDALDVEWPAAA
jgi:hypothetical protein